MLSLTAEEISNLIAIGNRADMKGAEADTWVALKQTLGAEGQRLVSEMQAKQDAARIAEQSPHLEVVDPDGN